MEMAELSRDQAAVVRITSEKCCKTAEIMVL